MLLFFYSFDVDPADEEAFIHYMEQYGTPVMSRYCRNWRFYKRTQPLRGSDLPHYIGSFEIPDLDQFVSSKPPDEMMEAMERADHVCKNIREWVVEQIV